MGPSARRGAFLLTLPLLVLGGAGLAVRGDMPRGPWRELLPVLLSASLGAAALLGLLFNRSRIVFAALGLAVAAAIAGRAIASGEAPAGLVLRELTAAVLALCLTAFALLAERGLGTRSGLLRAGVVLSPLGLLAWLARPEAVSVTELLHRRLQDARLLGLGPGLVLAAAAGLALVVRVVLRQSPLDAALAGAVAAVVLSLHAARGAAEVGAYGAAGGLLLVVGLVHESHRLAFRDELTGLPGRRALGEALAALEGRYAVAMLDIDHFKKFNDTYGHDVGDQVLRLVASRFACVGGGGRAFRYGGEEFTVLFPGRSAQEALPHLEALRVAVEQARLTLRAADRPRKRPDRPRRRRKGEQVSVTISIGAAERGERDRTPAQVLEAADKALYRAKHGGRNQVAV